MEAVDSQKLSTVCTMSTLAKAKGRITKLKKRGLLVLGGDKRPTWRIRGKSDPTAEEWQRPDTVDCGLAGVVPG
ncbi:unnamed protein product [Linum tenue]|uniref:Uncharacterized protein n=1 Tax=Linum tenue TaxID=586396 RepID=A0AAV0HET3_9ROSI|nr:unnamed protein product [Linum tenue]